jgi:uncharacterized membrane protein
MRRIFSLTLQGLVAVLPLVVTAYLLYWAISGIEVLVTPLIPQRIYFPGLGIISGLLLLIATGLLVNFYGIRYLVALMNRLMETIPLVKSIYGTIGDIITVFKLGSNKQVQSVVALNVGNDIQLIGFITSEVTGEKLFGDANKVAVYMPLSYQIGGYTMYVNREQLTPLNISVEEAMRLALTGGAQAIKPINGNTNT